MREHPKVDARLASIAPADRVVICSVVKGEIQYGIERLPQGARQFRFSVHCKAKKTILRPRWSFARMRNSGRR